MPKLTLDDISDLRAYERERDEFRRKVIALKRRRRVSVGDIVTLVFENAVTIRFQIQEMARAEKLISDEAIETELRIYNPLVPDPGQVCATLFIELTSDEQLREWLPKLVGIERSVALRLADGELVRALVDEAHEQALTREEITASVHYVRWELSPDQVARAAVAPLHLVLDHPDYAHSVELSMDAQAELLADLRHGG
jgi:uncharacterized protein DUF3501